MQNITNTSSNKVLGWEKDYIRYNDLELMIDQPTFDNEQFTTFALNELEHANDAVSRRVADIVTKLQRLHQRQHGLPAATQDPGLVEEANDAIEILDTVVAQNLQGLQKILQKYTARTRLSDAWFQARLANSRLQNARNAIHCLIVQLSEIYATSRETSSPDAVGKVWKPPDSFSRKTTKYWVKPEHATKVKLFVVRQLPILEITPSPKVSSELHDQSLDQTHNFISSIYFDNNQFESYHNRIEAREGARLLRVRWYGGTRKDSSKLPLPIDEDKVFVEMKTHHESWVQMDSVKDRFPLTKQLLPSFLNSTSTAAEVLQDMVRQGRMSEKEASKHLPLAEEVQDFVRSKRLRPQLRTFYHRTAFQSPTSNAVRISFDSPCYFFQDEERDGSRQWTSFESMLDSQDGLEPFPFGVFEVKIAQDNTPQWFEELEATGWLERVEKFSKFQTTVASTCPRKCRIIPHWMDAIPPTHGPVQSACAVASLTLVPSPLCGANAPVANGCSQVISHGVGLDTSSLKHHADCPSVTSGERPVSDLEKKRTNLVRTKVEPKTFFANERTFIQWLSASVLLVTLAIAVMTFDEQSRILGTILVPVALTFMLYSLWLYHWRLGKIIARDGSRFDDPYGPGLLTLVLSLAMIAIVAVLWLQPGAAQEINNTSAALTPLQHLESRHAQCKPLPTHPVGAPDSWVLQEELDPELCASPSSCLSSVRTAESRIARFFQVAALDMAWDETEELFCVPEVASDCSLHQIRRRRATGGLPEELTIVDRMVDLKPSFLQSDVPLQVQSQPGQYSRSTRELRASCQDHAVSHVVTVSVPVYGVFPQQVPARILSLNDVSDTAPGVRFEVSGGAWHPGWEKMVLVGDGDGGQLYIGDLNEGRTWSVAGDFEGAAVTGPESGMVYLVNEDDASIHEWSLDTESFTRRFDLLTADADTVGAPVLTAADRAALVDSGVYDVGVPGSGAEGLAFVPDENDEEGGLFWVASQATAYIYKFRLSLRSGGTSVVYLGKFSHWPGASQIASLEYDWGCGVILATDPTEYTMMVLNRDGTLRLTYRNLPGIDHEAVVADSRTHTIWIGEDQSNLLKEYRLPRADSSQSGFGCAHYSPDDVSAQAAVRSKTTAQAVNTVLGLQLYPPDAVMVLRDTRHSIRYRYQLTTLAGADAEVSWVVSYGSEGERAVMAKAVGVSVEVHLKGRPSLAAVRQAEGLLELLARPGSGSPWNAMLRGNVPLILLAAASPLILAAALMLLRALARCCRRWSKDPDRLNEPLSIFVCM
eukprot:3934200-Rhodomonas_salina.1